jgi:Acetyltransferase (isoleucine patch superfamily)
MIAAERVLPGAIARRRVWSRLQRAGRISVGAHSYGIPTVLEYGASDGFVSIGRYTAIARGVTLHLGGEHNTRWLSCYPLAQHFGVGQNSLGHPFSKGDVRIGSDVWVGHGASILSGVLIGNGAVIGAYAVVTKDVPPFSVVVGNPARVLRARFDERTIIELEKLAWWDLPDEQVRSLIPYLNSEDVVNGMAELRAQQSRAHK